MRSYVDMPISCRSCQSTDFERGFTTETIQKEGVHLVVYDVPSHTCTACGETHLSAEASEQIEAFFDEAHHNGVQVSIRRYRVEHQTR